MFLSIYFFIFFNMQPSTLYIVDASNGPAGIATALASSDKKLKQLPVYFNADNLEEYQCEAISKDGTKIPYFVVSRLKLNYHIVICDVGKQLLKI